MNASFNASFTAKPAKLLHVDYALFRKTLDVAAGPKVKSKGLSTLLYDKRNRILAVLKAPSIDNEGRCNPAQYFVNQQQIAPLHKTYQRPATTLMSA